MSMVISGFCDERFRPLEDAFRANFDQGLEVGASLGVTWRGKMAVDLWGGWANPKRTRRWRKNTIVQVYSTTKIMLVLAVLTLVDRRRIRLDDPICRYWPAFGQHGKDKVTVRDFITHQGGVPAFVPPVSFEDLHDWKRMTAHVAAQPHRFDGKKVLCYHPVTYGVVLGELIRRVDGRMPGRYFREVIARRVNADFHMGLSSWWDRFRVAETTEVPPPPPELRDSATAEIILSAPFFSGGNLRSWPHLSAVMPSVNGYANGRSIARACSIVALLGRVGWRRYLSKALVAQATTQQVAGEDLYIGRVRWGLGFALDTPEWPAPSPTTVHWGGLGGSWAAMDPAAKLSLGYAPNDFTLGMGAGVDPRIGRLNAALREIIPALAER
jgi:CubicO group peptidase (beta-lactamase class C family)